MHVLCVGIRQVKHLQLHMLLPKIKITWTAGKTFGSGLFHSMTVQGY